MYLFVWTCITQFINSTTVASSQHYFRSISVMYSEDSYYKSYNGGNAWIERECIFRVQWVVSNNLLQELMVLNSLII